MRRFLPLLILGACLALLAPSNAFADDPYFDKVIHPITEATWDPTHTHGLDPATDMGEILGYENIFELSMAITSRPSLSDAYYQDRQSWDAAAGAPIHGGRILLAATDSAGNPAAFSFGGLPPGWYWFTSIVFGSVNPASVLPYDVELSGEQVGDHRTTIRHTLRLNVYHYGLNAPHEMPHLLIQGIRFDNHAGIVLFTLSSPWAAPALDTRMHVEMRDCEFVDGVPNAYPVVAWLNGRGTFVDNAFTNSSRGPLVGVAGDGLEAEISRNVITGGEGYGIALTRHPYAQRSLGEFRVERNTINMSKDESYAIGIGGPYGPLYATTLLEKNEIVAGGSGTWGVGVAPDLDSESVTFMKSNQLTMVDGAEAGFFLHGPAQVLARANKVKGTATYGFALDDAHGGTFIGNNLATLTLDPDGYSYNFVNQCSGNDVRGYTGGEALVFDDTDDPVTPEYDGLNFLTGLTPMSGAGGVGPDNSRMNKLLDEVREGSEVEPSDADGVKSSD